MNTHTKGPWSVEKKKFGPHTLFTINSINGQSIGACGGDTRAGKANARLIATAPSMYEYLTTLAALGDTIAQQLIASVDYAESETFASGTR